MDRLKFLENILKAASTLVAALMSFIKFISMAFSMKTEKAQVLSCGKMARILFIKSQLTKKDVNDKAKTK